jgi:transketolase
MNGARIKFVDKIYEIGKNSDSNICVICADNTGAPRFDDIREMFGKRLVNVGIAEQNTTAVACGLALGGKRVVTTALAPFMMTRAFDQIRQTVANMRLPITICATGAGYSDYGITHSNIEDIALARTIPNLRVITPTDNIMGALVAEYILTADNPVYVRFDKNCDGEVYALGNIDFNRGFSVLQEGTDVALITYGYLTHRILDLDVNARIIDMYSLPFDNNELADAIGGLPVLVVEEHVAGGVGSMVRDAFPGKNINVMNIDFKGEYPRAAGSRDWYLAQFGLSDADIISAVNELSVKTS